MRTGPVRNAQQTKQCVYSIPCDCGICYIGEMSRPLEARIKEHKYNLTQGLLEKSKLAQHVYREGHRICWKEAKVLRIEPNTIHRKYKESAHMSLIGHRLVNPVWTPLSFGLPLSQQKKKRKENKNNSSSSSVQCKLSGEICVSYVGTLQRIYLSSDDFYSDGTLVLCLIHVEYFNVLA
jgi:predicted GIY-YIG superfamily endonuclease